MLDVTGRRRLLRAGYQLQRSTFLDLRQWSTVIAVTHVETLIVDPKEIESILLMGEDIMDCWEKVNST